MALYQTAAKLINDHIHGVATFPGLATPMKIRVFTANPAATGGGTEVVAGGDYATGGKTMAWSAATTATPSVSANQAASWTNWPRAETVTGIDITDSAGTPVKIEFGALTASKVMGAGDTLSFSAGAVTSSLQ